MDFVQHKKAWKVYFKLCFQSIDSQTSLKLNFPHGSPLNPLPCSKRKIRKGKFSFRIPSKGKLQITIRNHMNELFYEHDFSLLSILLLFVITPSSWVSVVFTFFLMFSKINEKASVSNIVLYFCLSDNAITKISL